MSLAQDDGVNSKASHSFAFPMIRCDWLSCTGTKLMESGNEKSRSSVTSTEMDMDKPSRFAICIKKDDDIRHLRVYPVINDDDAERTGMLRVIDDSGEDYLHATDRFIVINVSDTDAQRLLQAIQVPAPTRA